MSAPDLRRALAAHTEEEAAEAIAALCPRAAVLVVAGHLGVEPGPGCSHWLCDTKRESGAIHVRVCGRWADGGSADGVVLCRDCCDAHACPEAL